MDQPLFNGNIIFYDAFDFFRSLENCTFFLYLKRMISYNFFVHLSYFTQQSIIFKNNLRVFHGEHALSLELIFSSFLSRFSLHDDVN